MRAGGVEHGRLCEGSAHGRVGEEAHPLRRPSSRLSLLPGGERHTTQGLGGGVEDRCCQQEGVEFASSFSLFFCFFSFRPFFPKLPKDLGEALKAAVANEKAGAIRKLRLSVSLPFLSFSFLMSSFVLRFVIMLAPE